MNEPPRLMKSHDAALSAVPYFLNLGLGKAAIAARCYFADLGGNNSVVRQELALAAKAEKRGVAIAPDCGLSPGMASILGAELVQRLGVFRRESSRQRQANRADVENLRRQVRGKGDPTCVPCASKRMSQCVRPECAVCSEHDCRPVATLTPVDHHDAKTDMSAMMCTTAFPASIVVQMLASGVPAKRGAVLQECDVPVDTFLDEMRRRGIDIE